MTDTTDVTQAQQARRVALVERMSTIADLLCSDPLPGELGDIAYDLLREGAAQIASDRLRFDRLAHAPPVVADEGLVDELRMLNIRGLEDGFTHVAVPWEMRDRILTALTRPAIEAEVRAAERAQIVAWLRQNTRPGYVTGAYFADFIERGDHTTTPPSSENGA